MAARAQVEADRLPDYAVGDRIKADGEIVQIGPGPIFHVRFLGHVLVTAPVYQAACCHDPEPFGLPAPDLAKMAR